MIEWVLYVMLAVQLNGGETVYVGAMARGNPVHKSAEACREAGAKYAQSHVVVLCDPQYTKAAEKKPKWLRPALPEQFEVQAQ